MTGLHEAEGGAETPNGLTDPGFLARIALTLGVPGRAFATIDRAPGTWWQPLVLIAILNGALVYSLYEQVIIPEQLEAMARSRLEGEDLARSRSFIESGSARAMAASSALLGSGVGALASAAVAHGVAALLLGGTAGFARTLAVVCHALLVELPAHAAKVPVMLADRSSDVAFGPALFFSPEDRSSFLFNLLQQVDAFAIWKVALVGMGLASLHRIGRRPIVTACFVLWGLWALGAATIGSAFGD